MKESIIKSKLSQSALNIGAGSPTDAGLSFRGETDHPNPIQIAGGIPDFPTPPCVGGGEIFSSPWVNA